jgi:hypothetical protein
MCRRQTVDCLQQWYWRKPTNLKRISLKNLKLLRNWKKKIQMMCCNNIFWTSTFNKGSFSQKSLVKLNWTIYIYIRGCLLIILPHISVFQKRLKLSTLQNTKNKILLQQNITEGLSVLISAGRMDMLTEIYRGFIQYLQDIDGIIY